MNMLNQQVTKSQELKIFSFLEQQSKKMVECIIYKYPQANAKGEVKKLQRYIARTDIRESDQFDLLRFPQNIGVKFQYKEDGNYASQIMSVLNYVMEIAAKPLHSSNDFYSNFQGFNMLLQNIFTNAGIKQFEEEFFKDAKQYNMEKDGFKKSQLFQQMIQNSSFKFQQQDKKKSECYYKINKKIPSNAKIFKQDEIQNGVFTTSDVSVLRVMTKWAEQLKSKIENAKEEIFKRTELFKSKDGELIQLDRLQRKFLYQAAKQQKSVIQDVVTNLKKHCSIMGAEFTTQKHKTHYTNEIDGNLGIMCSNYQACIAKYMFLYLNDLIHSLLKIPIEAKKKYPKEFVWEQLKGDQMSTVNLLTFKIGDLLRSRCKAEENHILKIYQFMQKISTQAPQILRIVRTKDRLDGKDNDVLMNLFFMNKIQCEIQISVSTSVQVKQEHFNSFNHFIYELARAQFGPIAQCACIMAQYDPMTKLYTERPKLLSAIYLPSPKLKHRNSLIFDIKKIITNLHLVSLPFFCRNCQKFTINSNPAFYKEQLIDQICSNCYELQKNQSHNFIIELFSEKYQRNSSQMKKILKHFTILNAGKIKQLKYLKKNKNGYILNKNSQKPNPLYFELVSFNENYYFVTKQKKENQELKTKILVQLNKNLDWKSRLNSFIILIPNAEKSQFISQKNKQSEVQQIYLKCDCCQIPLLYLSLKFNALNDAISQQNLRTINQAYKKQKETVSMETRKVTFELQKIHPKNKIKRLLAAHNKIQNLNFIEKLQKLQEIDLSYNKINQLEKINYHKGITKIDFSNNQLKEIKCIESLSKLNILKINHNKIQKIQNLHHLKNIKYLSLNQNKISQIINLEELTEIKVLSLNQNNITKLQNIDSLKDLKQLFLYDNKIQVIQNLSNNKNLIKLYLRKNKIKKIQNINQLNQLQYLNLNQNQILKIQNMQNLTCLTNLYLFKNKFEKIQNLETLVNLQTLYLSNNKIKHIQGLQYQKKIKILSLSSNQIQIITGLGNLSQLETLYLFENKIAKIQNLQKLTQLTHLNLSNNLIEKIQGVNNLFTLKTLNISANKIKKIENLDKLHQLNQLSLLQNQIQKIQNLQSLTSLKRLYLGKNKIEEIQNLETLKSLTYLSLIQNKIRKIKNLQSLILLRHLYLYNNLIQKIQNLEKLTLLQTLSIFTNQIEKIENLEQLSLLNILSFSNNRISKIQNIQHLSNLTQLYLNGNKITKIQNLEKLTKLKDLQLQKNQIETIQNLEQLPELNILYLEKNKIKKVENISMLVFLTKFAISNNPLQDVNSQEIELIKQNGTKVQF